MNDSVPAVFADRHGLARLRDADPVGFAAALDQVAAAGAALPRVAGKESGPAGVFRPKLGPPRGVPE